MRIHLGEDYYLTSDAYQYIIVKHGSVSEKYPEGRDRSISFHSTIEQALQYYTELRLRTDDGVTEWKQVIQKVEELQSLVRGFTSQLKIEK